MPPVYLIPLADDWITTEDLTVSDKTGRGLLLRARIISEAEDLAV